MAEKIDGKMVSAAVLDECRRAVAELSVGGRPPGLAVVLVGTDPASQVYVGSKERTCCDLGMHSKKLEFPADVAQNELLDVVAGLNRDEEIDGILVQSPLPGHIDEAAVVRAIDPAKDVDGFHPENVAKLALEDSSGFVPCTPMGCQRLLEAYDIDPAGRHVVIVGRSLIVGKSLALLLMGKGKWANATVTVAHSRTADLAAITRQADILVAAVGVPEMLGAEHVREGAVVIDVGVNRVDDPERKRGYRLCGDVDFSAVEALAGAITPVPGGVGPMTIAMLMSNTVKACRARRQAG